MRTGERFLAALAALAMPTWGGGCSTRSAATVQASRPLGEAAAGPLRVTLRLEQRVVIVTTRAQLGLLGRDERRAAENAGVAASHA